MDINNKDTALLVTDPQHDFLSEKGAAWKLVGEPVCRVTPARSARQLRVSTFNFGFIANAILSTDEAVKASGVHR